MKYFIKFLQNYMKISIKVKPYSKKKELAMIGETEFVAYINKPPSGGKANETLIELISEYFDVPKSAVKIVAGYKSRNKIVEIEK